MTLTLLFFAAIGFAGAGVALAIARARAVGVGETDRGMRALALLLSMFGAACTLVGAGWTGIFAYGGVIVWFSYVLAAHRMGVFELVRRAAAPEPAARGRRIA